MVALGATCTLSMTDSYGDGWNGNEWKAPGFGQSFSLARGVQGTKSFVVQYYTLMSDALSWGDANAACLAAGL